MQAEPLVQARRACASGSALWRDGLVPEAHAFMASALRAALRTWLPVGEAGGPRSQEQAPQQLSTEEQALAALERGGYRRVGQLREALAATARITTPAPATAAGTEVAADFEAIWAETERLMRFTSRRFKPARERKRAQVRAVVGLALALLLVAVAVTRMWGRPRITASAVLAPEYSASNAVDGVGSTEWLLPDKTTGWVQISFGSPRRVHLVRVLNGHNRFFMDRAAQQIRVTALSKTGTIATAEGRFPGITLKESVLDLPLDARKVTDLRVQVLSYFGVGSALSEIEVR